MRQRKKAAENVDVPITPMLDMAFQLLTFFILTYHPMPSEVQFVMNLMPAAPAVPMSKTEAPAQQQDNPNLPAALKTLPTLLKAGEGGTIARIVLGENEVAGLDGLRRELKTYLDDPTLPFDQALIKVDPGLKYSELVRVIDIFSELKMTKISFAEATAADEGG